MEVICSSEKYTGVIVATIKNVTRRPEKHVLQFVSSLTMPACIHGRVKCDILVGSAYLFVRSKDFFIIGTAVMFSFGDSFFSEYRFIEMCSSDDILMRYSSRLGVLAGPGWCPA